MLPQVKLLAEISAAESAEKTLFGAKKYLFLLLAVIPCPRKMFRHTNYL
jgi:hypothetical protein